MLEDESGQRLHVMAYLIKCTSCGATFQHRATEDIVADETLNLTVMELHMRTAHASRMDKENAERLRSADKPRKRSWRATILSGFGFGSRADDTERVDP